MGNHTPLSQRILAGSLVVLALTAVAIMIYIYITAPTIYRFDTEAKVVDVDEDETRHRHEREIKDADGNVIGTEEWYSYSYSCTYKLEYDGVPVTIDESGHCDWWRRNNVYDIEVHKRGWEEDIPLIGRFTWFENRFLN